jgi:methylated-DNA-protein-cysteine methyltransferase-like protein
MVTETGRNLFAEICDVVRQIPLGKVATYGQISHYVAGSTPRIVGFALAGLGRGPGLKRGSPVPWQRVINAKGEISPHAGGEGSGRQREILTEEGIEFDLKGRIDLGQFGWKGPARSG